MIITIAGDLCVMQETQMKITKGDTIFDDGIKKIISESDYSIVNLEAPIINDTNRPIFKSGPNISNDDSILDIIKEAGFSIVSLANNHFKDFGEGAINNTLRLLEKNAIKHVGGGYNLKDASRILYLNNGDCRVSIINCCEQEYSIASEKHGGANPLRPLEQYYQIKDAKDKSDFVILIVHGGIEHFQYPTPRMKETYRFFVDVGADVVINHHQHCYSGFEIYKNRPIFYGLGNFFFNANNVINSNWNMGYMVQLELDNNKMSIGFELHPYYQCNGNLTVSYQKDRSCFDSSIKMINSIILDDERLKAEYDCFVDENSSFYNCAIKPYHSRLLAALYERDLLPKIIDRQQLLFLYDVINCDSHRDRFLSFLLHNIYKQDEIS